MCAEVGQRCPHRQAVVNKLLGILMLKLRPLPPVSTEYEADPCRSR